MDTEVLVAGAGPTGLTLAIELARRGIAVRIVDRAAEPHAGSRGDGLQPRTLEVFDDLGILDGVLAEGMLPAPIRAYLDGEFAGEHRMAEPQEPTPDVPHPNTWVLAQYDTERLLTERLAQVGVRVERGVELTELVSDEDGAAVTVGGERARVRYLVGADGGGSTVRRALGIPFPGTTDETVRMLLGDVHADELDHDFGHWWAPADRPMDGVVLSPLPGGTRFQLGCPMPEGARTDLATLQRQLEARGGQVRLHDLTWSTIWRPNVRLADRFREGSVFLAGDAAHVHPPTGGQGLNTGVQDAYNLGWKLAAVLRGAAPELLDTYEAERRPVAADVLGVSTKLLDKHRDGEADAYRRGAEVRQLGINYRGGPLARESRAVPGRVRAGDRAPDAPVLARGGSPVRLFEFFRGTGWTLLRFGGATGEVTGATTVAMDGESFVDHEGHAAAGYDVDGAALVLVRPDGYVAVVADDPAGLPASVADLAAVPVP